MKEKVNTHEFLHKQGLSILINDIETLTNANNNTFKNLMKDITVKYKNKFIKHAKDPDNLEAKGIIEYKTHHEWGVKTEGIMLNIKLFSNHFFDPNSATNFTEILFNYNGGLAFNAHNIFIEHVRISIEEYKNNNCILNDKVVEHLSYACHYLEDMCESHHVTNKIGQDEFNLLKKASENPELIKIINQFDDISNIIEFVISKREHNTREGIEHTRKIIKNMDLTRLGSLLSNHKEFEAHATKNKERFIISSCNEFHKIDEFSNEECEYWKGYDFYSNYNIDFKEKNKFDDFKLYCSLLIANSAMFAKGMDGYTEGLVISSGKQCYVNDPKTWKRLGWALSDNINDWEKNEEQTLKMAQIRVASFLYNYLYFLSCITNNKV